MSRPARTTICWSRRSSADPGTLGVLGYSYLEENADKVRAGADRRRRADRGDDRRPSLSRRAQALHLPQGRAPAGQAQDARFRRRNMPRCGARAARSSGVGLVPFGGADADAAAQQATDLTPLDPSGAEVSGAAGAMSLGLALVAILIVAVAAGWLGYRARRPPARAAAGCTRCRSITAPMRRCGRRSRRCCSLPPGRRCNRSMVDRAVLASPEGRALPDFDDAARVDPVRSARDRQRRARAGLQSAILDPRAANPRREARYALIGGAVAILVALVAAGLALRRSAPALPRPHRSRALADDRAVRGLADRDPDDARHPALADVREPALLPARTRSTRSCSALEWSPQTAIRADQAGSSGAFGSVPLVLGHVLHRRDHRHDRRRPAGADVRDLPDPICAARGCARGSSRSSRFSPACRPWSTAISPR